MTTNDMAPQLEPAVSLRFLFLFLLSLSFEQRSSLRPLRPDRSIRFD